MKFGSICQEPLIRESKEKPARTHKKPTLYDVASIGGAHHPEACCSSSRVFERFGWSCLTRETLCIFC